MLIAVLCVGCDSDLGMDAALALRQQLQKGGCEFVVRITADYGDLLHVFDMKCTVDQEGKLLFTVINPKSIEGITGVIDGDGGQLTFDDSVLAFKLLADGLLTPVSAPWVFIRTLKAGYIHASTKTDNGTKLIIHDTYEEDSLQLDIWLDTEDTPVAAEILWQGRRILSMTITNFSLL